MGVRTERVLRERFAPADAGATSPEDLRGPAVGDVRPEPGAAAPPSPAFDLAREPWIPARDLTGRPLFVSLRTALTEAHWVADLEGDDPLVTASLYRHLLALFQRVYGPRTVSRWSELWHADRVDPGPLDTYLARWPGRFDLFDRERPFGQAPARPDARACTVAHLMFDRASGHSPSLWSHQVDSAPPRLSPAEAARYLLAYHAYAAGGRIPNERAAYPAGPIRHGAMVLLMGETLLETLLLNTPIPGVTARADAWLAPGDLPAWERPDPLPPSPRAPTGWLDALTWTSRSVALHPAHDTRGLHVSLATVSAGTSSTEDAAPDPLVPLARARADAHAWPIRLVRGRAVWRDLPQVLPSPSAPADAPVAFEQAAALVACGALPPNRQLEARWLGLEATRAKAHALVDERVPLPCRLLVDQEVRDLVAKGLLAAERVAAALAGGDLARTASTGAAATDPPPRVTDALGTDGAAERLYWFRLGPYLGNFVDLSSRLAEGALRAWSTAVDVASREAWEAKVRRSGPRGFRYACQLAMPAMPADPATLSVTAPRSGGHAQ